MRRSFYKWISETFWESPKKSKYHVFFNLQNVCNNSFCYEISENPSRTLNNFFFFTQELTFIKWISKPFCWINFPACTQENEIFFPNNFNSLNVNLQMFFPLKNRRLSWLHCFYSLSFLRIIIRSKHKNYTERYT